jgi:predicted MFS family arabinose efflux permease
VRTIGAGAVALVLMGLFVWLESRIDSPMVPLRMFLSRNTSGATVVRFLFPIGMFGNFFVGALYFQHILGYSPVATGLAFLPMNLLIALFSLLLTARVMNRIGARNAIIPGLLLVFGGLLVFVFLPVHATYVADVLPGMVLVGAGAGLAFSPSVALAMHDAAPADIGLASGLANTSIQLGAALGVALLASVSETRTRSLSAAGIPSDSALVSGYHLAYLVAAGCIAIATVFAVFIFRDRTIGRTLTTEEQVTASMLEPEIGL